MRIGIIAPPWVTVPPVGYGGTESVIDNLARGLQARGVDVRLFTVGTSTCPVPRHHLYDEAVRPMNTSVSEAAHVLAGYEALDDVDLIHDHTVLGPLLSARLGVTRVPVVTTVHGAFDDRMRRIAAESARHAAVVAISRSHARAAVGVPISAVVPHGVDLDAHRPGGGAGGHLMFVGRMSPDKGVHRAVEIARDAGRRLVIASKLREPEEHEYYENHVRPLLGPEDEGPSEMAVGPRLRLLADAAALVNPIRWPEPFGLVMAESLACATPVLAFGEGAAPEIVDHGVTGYLCRDDADMVARCGQLDLLDRDACRAAAESRFSVGRMARDHESLYRRILDRAPSIVARRALAAGA
jgi:glycosyltransferase involved in cell wall biosynthesis